MTTTGAEHNIHSTSAFAQVLRVIPASIIIAMGLSLASASLANEPDQASVDREIMGNFMREVREVPTIRVPDIPGNIAITTQIGNNNDARIQQGSKGYPNLAAIHQSGYGNDAEIIQEGGNNVGVVAQRGNNLEANLHQRGGEFEAAINQVGVRGKVNLSQSGSGYRTISIDQISRSGAGTTATIVTN
ncbi:hypothetical protein GCM10017767_17590 [Halomonas urumqiensis]|nr:hypothetical protein GCM10017767_17590 [Halomonas urumqiensis]